MTEVKEKMLQAVRKLDAALTRHKNIWGLMLAAMLSGLMALYNVSSGPLSNLNDIGGWSNRFLMIALTAVMMMLVLSCAVLLHKRSFSRLALRELILTAGMMILLLGINQKTFVYSKQVQPIVRLMDETGLAAMAGAKTNLSAPALTLLYLVTRGPIYDMYLVKLLCIAAFMGLGLLAVHAADERGWGIRAEALLTLCLILPQGFLSAGCAAQLEIVSALLLGISLTLLAQKRHPLACALTFGAAFALCGAALYALPFYLFGDKKLKPAHLAAALGLALALCVPAVIGGVPAGEAFSSLVRANLALPEYAAGVPNAMSIISRAPVEEMPQYFLLRQIPALDTVTNFPEYFTQAHYAVLVHGVTLAALAAYVGLCAVKLPPMRRAFMLAVAAMFVCPGAGAGFFLALAVLCVYVIFAEPELRIPACLVLFATAGGLAYPVTQEVLLPLAAGVGLVGAALCMTLGILPGAGRKETND